MFDSNTLDNLAKQLYTSIPASLRDIDGDLQQKFTATLQVALAKLELVTREEFDAVRAMAQKAREENEALKARLDALEKAVRESADE